MSEMPKKKEVPFEGMISMAEPYRQGYCKGFDQCHDQFTEYLKERCSGIEEIIRNGGSLISNNENYTEDVNHLANAIKKHLGVIR